MFRCLEMSVIITWQAIFRLNGALSLAGFWLGFNSADHYQRNSLFPYFFLCPGKFKFQTQKVFKKQNLTFSS